MYTKLPLYCCIYEDYSHLSSKQTKQNAITDNQQKLNWDRYSKLDFGCYFRLLDADDTRSKCQQSQSVIQLASCHAEQH